MKQTVMSIVESWKDHLLSMGKNEMLLVVYEHEKYAPEIVAIAKEVLKQKFGMTDEDILAIPQPEHVIVEKPTTRDFLINALTEMGCRVYFENDECEDDGSCYISFLYMGEWFYANAINDNVYADIEKYCGSCKLEDVEEVARVKEAINVVNEQKRVKMFYQKDEEFQLLYIHCTINFTLTPLIPSVEFYLHNQLKAILNVEKYYNNVLEDWKTRKDIYESRVKDYKLRTRKERLCGDKGDLTKSIQRDKSKTTGSRDLFLDTLVSIGCPHRIDDDDNSIRFEHHGNVFYAEADNEYPYVSLYYYSWSAKDLEDIEDISETVALRNAINEANWKYSVITVFDIDEEEKRMYVHSRTEILFIPEIPYLEEYLMAVLSRFYRVEYSVKAKLL